MTEEELDQTSPEELYWKAQGACIDALAKMNILYSINDRVQPMQVMRAIAWWRRQKPEDLTPGAQEILDLANAAVAELVRLRTEGLEPAHSLDKYT